MTQTTPADEVRDLNRRYGPPESGLLAVDPMAREPVDALQANNHHRRCRFPACHRGTIVLVQSFESEGTARRLRDAWALMWRLA